MYDMLLLILVCACGVVGTRFNHQVRSNSYHIISRLFRPPHLDAMQSTPCSCLDGNCNFCWNEEVFSQLGLPLVWMRNGLWIAGYERYIEGGTQPLGWYAYCDAFGIPWPYPRLLPDWAIANMDEQHEYGAHFDGDLYAEENDRKYTYVHA